MRPLLNTTQVSAACGAAASCVMVVSSCVLSSCGMVPQAYQGDAPDIGDRPVRLTILHTADIHSRLLEYDFDPSFTDNQLGLADETGPYGGIAEIGYILRREREKAGRVLHLDSGDCFQGAIIFNEFHGEAEMRSLSALGLDAAVIANHEFDAGAANLAHQYGAWGEFDLLAANYRFEDSDLPWSTELADQALPSVLYELDGLRVGVIGLANVSSLNSIYDESNSMGVTVMEPEQVVPEEAAKLRDQGADIIVVLSHMGLDDDLEHGEAMADIDVIIGGHHHVAIDPPLVVTNHHTGRRVPVVHSGAFAKFVGRTDLIIQSGQVVSHDYSLFPIDASVDRDPVIVDLIEEYSEALEQDYNTGLVLGYASEKLTRYGTTGGDSMLGNLASEAMRFTPGVETEIALTNTLGIRSDISIGDITLDDLYNAMPFDNTITTMFLSGFEVQELLDYVSSRSTERGCNSQAQVAGIRFDMVCDPEDPHAENIFINGRALDEFGTYELATNNYIAHGGSGFEVLENNTTQVDTGISIRDVVMSAIIQAQSLPQPEERICVEDGRINPVF